MSAELFNNAPENEPSYSAQKNLAIQALEKITGVDNFSGNLVDYFDLENIHFVADSFLEKYIQYEAEALDDTVDVDDELSDIDEEIENRLEEHRELHRLIEIDDLVIARGDFIGKVMDLRSNTYVQFRNDVEVRGEFGGVYVGKAPSVEELELLLKKRPLSRTGEKALEVTYKPSEELTGPCFLIFNPTFIHHLGNGVTYPEHTIDVTLEIPLTHNKRISYHLLRESSL